MTLALKIRSAFRIRAITFALLACLIVAGIVSNYIFSRSPHGCYSTYKVYPHDKSDLACFINGSVWLGTCCGDEYWGYYYVLPDGRWSWHYKGMNDNPFVIYPGYFGLTLFDKNGKKLGFIRRRLSTWFLL